MPLPQGFTRAQSACSSRAIHLPDSPTLWGLWPSMPGSSPASLPFTLSAQGLRRLAVVAVLLAGIGIAGETAIGVMNSAPFGPASSSLVTFGGFPLVNLNLPFGAVVAVSAALMWVAYQRASSRFAERPGREPVTRAGG